VSQPLTTADFPLYAIGRHVYRRTEPSPLFMATDDDMAANLAHRLNVEEMRTWSVGDVFGRIGELTTRPAAPDAAQAANPATCHTFKIQQ